MPETNAPTDDERAMLAAYVDAARAGWQDPGQMDRLEREPRTVLAEHGWSAPEGVELHCDVVEVQTGASASSAGVEDIVAHWRRGIEAGEVRFAVPRQPVELEPQAISDEELAGVSGGLCCFSLPLDSPKCWMD
jgi:hypothetical protein